MAEIQYGVKPDDNDALVLISGESWCVPCQRFAPVYDKAAAEYDGDTNIYKIDVDEHPELLQGFSVQSVPTVIRIKDGKQEYIEERSPVKFVNYVKSL